MARLSPFNVPRPSPAHDVLDALLERSGCTERHCRVRVHVELGTVTVRHGENGEAARVFQPDVADALRGEPILSILDWLHEVHAYEDGRPA